MPGQLFTQYFLTDGIRHTSEWRSSVDRSQAFTAFTDAVTKRFEAFSRYDSPNESVTEQDLIRPVLTLLGWVHNLPQQGSARNEDIPDHLLFADAESKARAAGRNDSEQRYRDALLIEESKRLGLPLDTREATGKARAGTPHGQIRRYLSTADSVTDGRLRWGILTNGGVWRLYDHRARPRASGYYEADLAALLRPGNEDALRTFYLLFRRDSFNLRDGAQAPFLETALAEGRRYEEQVARDLSNVVFDTVFPGLVTALARQSTRDLPEIRDAALIFLYRLLFVLYAEDRGLLPVNDPRYDDYGLRKRVRDDIARRTQDGDTFSTHAASYYNHLTTLFTLIDKGDASIGLPPYNGGLFAPASAPMLETARLSDTAVAPILYAMSHRESHFVNYRDMSVQQLGSIYERLLEREPVRGGDGSSKVSIRPNAYARKDSGSFYTPQELVDLIVDRTLKPLAEERLKAFEDKAAALQNDRRPKAERHAELTKLDPAEAGLDLKVLDPAMGSGHFLVTAVDFLSDYISELIEYVPAVPAWLDGAYASPLVQRIERIRHDILQRAAASNWVIDEAQLTDQAIIRRMVLKRCIYGVDKNRLTVELAKVSLWLHSFTVGAPLSFLDHHLRVGDSLIGVRVQDATGRVAPARRPVRRFRHRRRRGRHRGHATHRGDVRRRRGRGAGIGVAVRAGGGNHCRPARPARFLLRLAVAHGRHEDTGERSGGRATGGRLAGRCLQPVGPRPGANGGPASCRRRGLGAVCRVVAQCPRHCRPRRLPTLGGCFSRRLAALAKRPPGRRFRRRHRQPAVGPYQAAGGRVVRHSRPRARAGANRGSTAKRHSAAARRG